MNERLQEITNVQSVDLVADPTSTSGLPEPAGNENNPFIDSLTVDRLREVRPDLVEEVLADSQKRIAQLQEEVDELRSSQNVSDRREKIQALLTEYELSPGVSADPWRRRVVSDTFLESLTNADDEQAMRHLIQERIDLVRELARGEAASAQRTSREQSHLESQQSGDVEAFVHCIRDKSVGRAVPHRNAVTGRP